MGKNLFRRFLAPCIKKEAFVAASPGSIFDNLSLEATLTERCIVLPGWSLLLIYISNPPCIVVGRHQNPWLECSVRRTEMNEVAVARRISGGGTVYHDSGNINFSVVSDRADYDRQKNLSYLVSSLTRCGIPESRLSITDKYDVLLDGRKISGTAARLDKFSSLHHFTCLISANIGHMERCLEPSFSSCQIVSSRATPSRTAPVTNAIAAASDIPDSSSVLDSKMCTVHEILCNDDMLLRDYERRQSEYRTWNWIYGKTPPFVLLYKFDVIGQEVSIKFYIENGCVQGINLCASSGAFDSTAIAICEGHLMSYLKGLPLRTNDIRRTLQGILSEPRSELEQALFDNVFSFLLQASTTDADH